MSDPKKRDVNDIFTRGMTVAGVERIRAEEDDAPDIYEFKLASEEPVEVYRNELEILSHDPSAVRTDFIGSGNAPLLWMHNRNEPRGIIESARVEDGFLMVKARFGNSDKARALKEDVDSGITKNVSVGYRIHAYQFTESREDGTEVYTVTDWEPLEGSFVTIPADKSVGMGRSASFKDLLSGDDKPEDKPTPEPTRSHDKPKAKIMDPKENPPIDLDKEREKARTDERVRTVAIRELASKTKIPGVTLDDIAERAIAEGDSVESFRTAVLAKIQENAPKLNQIDMGADKKDQKRYSIQNVMNGIRDGNLKDAAPYELEVSQELKKRMGKGGDTVAIPHDIALRGWIPKNPQALAIMARNYGMSARDLQAVTLNGAGQNNTSSNIVDTELLDEMFVYSLREESSLLDSGVVMIPGLVGNIEIPVELLNPDFEWVGEDAEPTEGNYGLGKVGLNFRTLAAQIPFTRQADKQTMPGIENLLVRSVRKGASLGLASAFYGAPGVGGGASPIPRGILATAGVGAVASGGAYSRDLLIDMEIALGNSNVSGDATSFLNTTSAGGFAKERTDPGAGMFVGKYRRGTRRLLETEIGDLNIDNLVPANTMIHGVPSSLVAGMWGTLELGLDTSTKANTGGKVVRVFLDADCVVPQPANWVVCTDLP